VLGSGGDSTSRSNVNTGRSGGYNTGRQVKLADRPAARDTDRFVSEFEEKVLTQKADKYSRFNTIPARLAASDKVDELTRDIDARFAENRVLIRQHKKAAHERRVQERKRTEDNDSVSEGSVISFVEPEPSITSPSTTRGRPASLDAPTAQKLAADVLRYEIPRELHQGASFSLWPPRAFGVSTALRLSNGLGVAGEPPSDGTFATRWEQEREGML